MNLYISAKKDYIDLKNLASTDHMLGGYLSVSQLANTIPIEPTRLKNIRNREIQNMFPNSSNVDKNELFIDRVGFYSMTKPWSAKKIMDVLKRYFDPAKITLVSATSGIGGDLICIAPYFKFIYGYEIDKTRFDMLSNNVAVYDLSNVKLFNEDYTQHINREDADAVLVDPPWGGLDYKKLEFNNTMISDLNMADIVNRVDCRWVIMKLPQNQDMRIFEGMKYDIHHIDNYLLIVFVKQVK